MIKLTWYIKTAVTVLCLQADTTDTEHRQAGTHPESMDFLDGPEARDRAFSVASVITSTMEGRDCVHSIPEHFKR